MKRSVIRVLWPQPQQDVLGWQCECHFVSDAGEATSGAVMLDLPAAFQQASASQQLHDDMEVVVLLPGELAILNYVQVPVRSQRQVLQALPFVVEEQLADDIEKAHLAIGNRSVDGKWPVLVVDVAIMEALASICGQTGLRLHAVYIDAQVLRASEEGCVSVFMHDDRVLFHSKQLMAVFDLVSAASMIHFALGESPVSEVTISYCSNNEEQALLAQQLSTEFTALGDAKVATETYENHEAVSSLLSASSLAINLLQGRFTVRHPSKEMPWWQLAIAALLALWLGQLVLQVGSGWYFNSRADVLEQASEAQYQKLFPDAKNISNPRKRLESRLLENGNAEGANAFASLFSGSVQALNGIKNRDGLSIENLRYESQQGELELELKASSIDQLDEYKQALGTMGFSGKITSANDSEGSITGRMQISKGM